MFSVDSLSESLTTLDITQGEFIVKHKIHPDGMYARVIKNGFNEDGEQKYTVIPLQINTLLRDVVLDSNTALVKSPPLDLDIGFEIKPEFRHETIVRDAMGYYGRVVLERNYDLKKDFKIVKYIKHTLEHRLNVLENKLLSMFHVIVSPLDMHVPAILGGGKSRIRKLRRRRKLRKSKKRRASRKKF
jgi:hypothetical protein